MNIVELRLQTSDLRLIEAFYAETLGLTQIQHSSQIAFQVGRSRLVFMHQENFSGQYHFAFDVPNNQFIDACAWLEARVPLLQARDGTTVFHSDDWHADMCYFFDSAGNILELIARHTASTASRGSFSSASLLAVSEIGLATAHVADTVEWMRTALNVQPYGTQSPSFTPVGDVSGLLIIVQNQREWFPDTGIEAVPLPVYVTLEGSHTSELTIPDTPYHVRLVTRTSLSNQGNL